MSEENPIQDQSLEMTLDASWDADPLTLTEEQRTLIIQTLRERRHIWLNAEGTKRARKGKTAPKEKPIDHIISAMEINLDDIPTLEKP